MVVGNSHPDIAMLDAARGVSAAPMQQKQKPLDEKGPGTHLHRIIGELGYTEAAGCGCWSMILWMNELGIEGCKKPETRACIVKQLKKSAAKVKRTEKLKTAWKLAFSVNWFDPFGSLVDEAIRRAEA